MRRLMRRLLCDCVVTLVVACITTSHADAVTWTRSGSPVLTESSDMAWFDSGYIAGPKIVYDSDSSKYFMYYTGCVDADGINRESIGLATASSLSGSWTKYASPNDRHALFAPGPPDSFYYMRNWGSGTIRRTASNSWEMWTVGSSGTNGEIRPHQGRVGYATSADGYNWTMYDGSGFGGSVFEDFAISSSGFGAFAVLKEGNTYNAWYSGLYVNNVKHATSANGIDWTIVDTPITGINPVYTVDNVFKIGSVYYMATGKSNLGGIDIYTSTNKTTWTLLEGGSLSPSAQGWDSARVYQSFLYPESESDWYFFYTGASVPDGTQSKIGYAYATVPEPSTVSLLGMALLMLLSWCGYSRRRGATQ